MHLKKNEIGGLPGGCGCLLLGIGIYWHSLEGSSPLKVRSLHFFPQHEDSVDNLP